MNLHERDIRVEAERIGQEKGAHDKAVETARNCSRTKKNTPEKIFDVFWGYAATFE